MSTALQEWLANHEKSQKWLAGKLSVKPPSVNAWMKTGVPPARVPEIATLTGLSYHEINPECFPRDVTTGTQRSESKCIAAKGP